MEIIANRARRDQVLDYFLSAFDRGIPPYDDLSGLQYAVPTTVTKGSVEEAVYLFYTRYYMRGLINSNTAFSALSRMYDEHPKVFRPAAFLPFTSKEQIRRQTRKIWKLLQIYGLGINSKQTSRHWVLDSQKLAKFWNGDPRLLFQNAVSYEDACDILMNSKSKDPSHGFFGFREKMVSMVLYLYVRAGIIPALPYPIPVDFHALRIFVAHEILSVEGMGPRTILSADSLSMVARELSLEYCAKRGVEPRRLADAIWHYSREFCKQHPGNAFSKGRYNGRKTPIAPKPVHWGDAQTRAYHRTCGRCGVESTCMWNIPSAQIYTKGTILVARARARPLDLFISSPDPK